MKVLKLSIRGSFVSTGNWLPYVFTAVYQTIKETVTYDKIF